MKLIIEFPLNIIVSHNGASNLDETLDECITPLIKSCYNQKNLECACQLEFVSSQPNTNDELIRFTIDSTTIPKDFHLIIYQHLKTNGYEKGLTIKTASQEVLIFDRYTADIQLRRKVQ